VTRRAWRRLRADHAPRPSRQARVSGLRRGCVPRRTERRPDGGARCWIAQRPAPTRPPGSLDARACRDPRCGDHNTARRLRGQPRRGATVDVDRRPRAGRRERPSAGDHPRSSSPRRATGDGVLRTATPAWRTSHGVPPPRAACPTAGRARTRGAAGRIVRPSGGGATVLAARAAAVGDGQQRAARHRRRARIRLRGVRAWRRASRSALARCAACGCLQG
jgi:hypothetical protein